MTDEPVSKKPKLCDPKLEWYLSLIPCAHSMKNRGLSRHLIIKKLEKINRFKLLLHPRLV